MRRVYKGAILAAAVAALILIALHAPAPLLYSEKAAAVTRFHTNPGGLSAITPEDAGSLLPLMSGILDQHGTLMLNVRLENYELAARDLRDFAGMASRMDRLVIRVDMSGSEIENWRRLNEQDLALLSEIINSTSGLSQLRELELQMRSENNPSEMYSVTIRGETLRQTLRQLVTRYQANVEPNLRMSRQYELNTSRYEKSVDDLAAIAEKFDIEQNARYEVVAGPAATLIMGVFPDRGVYNDILEMSGVLRESAGPEKNIVLYIDGGNPQSVPIGEGDSFAYHYRIDRITAGEHIVYAQYGPDTFSKSTHFTVDSLDTSLTLAISSDRDVVRCTGGLSAHGIPVTRAPLTLVSENAGNVSSIATVTDDEGQYSAEFTLPPGTSRIYASFGAEGYPLTPSRSRELTISVQAAASERETSVIPLLLAAGIVVSSMGAAIWYFRRKAYPLIPTVVQTPAAGETRALPVAEARGLPMPSREEVVSFFRSEVRFNAGEAVRHLYLYLAGLCEARLLLRNARSLTAREFCRWSRGRPFASPLREFVARYEPVRYGGDRPSEEAQEAILARFGNVTDAITGGDDT